MSAEALLARAKETRCLLPEVWEEAAGLSGREQLEVARALSKIKPAKVERHGRIVPCEADWQLKPRDRKRLVRALLDEKAQDGFLLANVPGLTERTLRRIKADTQPVSESTENGSTKGRIRPKTETPVGRPWIAFRDATSGANLEAEEAFKKAMRL